jgi:hypothetical protein
VRSKLKNSLNSIRQWYSPFADTDEFEEYVARIYYKQEKRMKIDPKYVVNEKGEKLAVQLTLEEFEYLKSKAFKGSREEGSSGRRMQKQPPGRPIPFEMHEEFCSADGVLLPDGIHFKVVAGAKASGIIDKTLEPQLKTVRKELIMLQVMVKDSETGDYIFSRDYEFPNPTYAASILAGSARDGHIAWICPENGQILGAYC